MKIKKALGKITFWTLFTLATIGIYSTSEAKTYKYPHITSLQDTLKKYSYKPQNKDEEEFIELFSKEEIALQETNTKKYKKLLYSDYPDSNLIIFWYGGPISLKDFNKKVEESGPNAKPELTDVVINAKISERNSNRGSIAFYRVISVPGYEPYYGGIYVKFTAYCNKKTKETIDKEKGRLKNGEWLLSADPMPATFLVNDLEIPELEKKVDETSKRMLKERN
jgi:hypothetical protein